MSEIIRNDEMEHITITDSVTFVFRDDITEYFTITDTTSAILSDYITDTITITDSVRETPFVNITDNMVVEDIVQGKVSFIGRIRDTVGRIRDGTFKFSSRQDISDSLSITDSIIDKHYHALYDNMTIRDSARGMDEFKTFVIDRTMRITDATRSHVVIRDSITDTVTITDEVLGIAGTMLTDAVNITDEVQGKVTYIGHIIDRTMRITDATRQVKVIVAQIIDHITLTDSSTERVIKKHQVIEDVHIVDEVQGQKSVIERITDEITIMDSFGALLKLVVDFITEKMTITDSFYVEPFSNVWTTNTDIWAMSRYEIPQTITKLTVVDGVMYGITDDGLVKYGTPETDITASVISGRMDVGMKLQTHPTTGYLSIAIPENDHVGLSVNNVEYPVPMVNIQQYEPRRVKLGRGFRERYYEVKLTAVTKEFDLIDFDIQFVESKRRI